MTALINKYHNYSELSSLHAGPAGRKRGRAKTQRAQAQAQVRQRPVEHVSSNEETALADQPRHPNHCNYLALGVDSDNRSSDRHIAIVSTNTMNENGRTSLGTTSSNVPGRPTCTNANGGVSDTRTNSGTSRDASARENISADRGIHVEAAAEYNEGGSGDYPTPPTTPPSSSSRQQLLHYLLTNWKSLALGQVLSVLLSTAGITQSTLYASCGLSAPTLSVAFVYLINSFHLCRLRNRRHRGERLSMDADVDGDWSARLETVEESNTGDSNETSASTNKGSTSKGAEILRMASHPTHTFCGLQINAPPWMYIILAFLDVEANYLTVLAYRYTTLTSVTLFDALAIPSAMILSKWWLGRAYGRIHLVGVALCMVGVVVNVCADYKIVNEYDDGGVPYDDDGFNNRDPYPNRIRGDILAICGGILYGVNDTVCEIAVRAHGHASEFLGMVGLFAGVIAIVQAAIVEREAIAEFFAVGNGLDDNGEDTCSAFTAWGLLTAFVAVNVLSYSGAAFFLLLSEAAFFNLSLLTGDLWTVIFSVTAQHIIPGPLFFVALVLIVGGVVIYEMAPSPATKISEENGWPREDSFEMTQGIVGGPRYQSGELT